VSRFESSVVADRQMFVIDGNAASQQPKPRQVAFDLLQNPNMKKEGERKRVTFLSQVYYREIPSRHDMTKQEKRRLWFGESGWVSVAGKRTETLAMMEAGLLQDDDDEYCKRGLFTRQENRERFEIMEASWDAVLRVQEVQMEEGYFDAGEIAFKYFKTTQASRFHALEQGNKDQRESQDEQVLSAAADRWPSDSSVRIKDAWDRRRSLTDAVGHSLTRGRVVLSVKQRS
jgi:hypothetical protein